MLAMRVGLHRKEHVMGRALLALGLLIGTMGFAGCIAAVGGEEHTPTKGQELIDLKTALERGAITQAEYDLSKSQILSRH